MNAPLNPRFPLNPYVGQRYGQWVWNGGRWVCAPTTGIMVNMQVFTPAGSYIYQPSPGLVTAVVETVGAGGGGGGALGSVPPGGGGIGFTVGGGGGAGGNYSRSALPAQLVLGGVGVTVGAGGAGGPAVEGVQGGMGGTTSFGALVVAVGGGAGWSNLGANTGTNLLEGQGGARTDIGNVGQLSVWGAAGGQGSSDEYDPGVSAAVAMGGHGGNSHFQSSGRPVRQSAGGDNGIFGAFGAGGGGAASSYSNASAIGGPGGDGLCIVTEYCWADQTGDTGCEDPCGGGAARVSWQGNVGWQE